MGSQTEGNIMKSEAYLNLNVDFSTIKSYEDYKNVWNKISPVEITMIEKFEQCSHDLGDKFVYKNHYDKPAGICTALHHVLQLYLWRAALGFPSWESDPGVFKIHCPDKKGTVWELRRKTE
jgi:uncharacterized repeat protein (TIGR04076 family)